MKRIKGKGSDWAEKMRRGAQGEAFGLIRREGEGHEIVADGKEKRDESADLASESRGVRDVDTNRLNLTLGFPVSIV